MGTSKADKAEDRFETVEGAVVGASAAEARATVMADTAEAHTDRVAMVSRAKDGSPDQEGAFKIVVPETAADEQKRRAENRPEDNRADDSGTDTGGSGSSEPVKSRATEPKATP